MPSKTITVSTEKWERVKAAFAKSIPTDPETHQPEFTEAQWPFEALKRYVARTVRSHEKDLQGTENAPEFDKDILTVS